MTAFLAHGQLGAWDELIFLGITVLFALIMVFSWLRSRNLAADEPEDEPEDEPHGAAEHFGLD